MKSLRLLKPRRVYFAFLLAMTMLSLSCERKQNEEAVSPNLSSSESFAVFKTYDEFQKTVAKLSKGTHDDVVAFEKKHNFVSLSTLLMRAEQEEATNHERELKMLAEKPQLVNTMKHEISKTIQENPESFIYSAEEGVRLNLILSELSRVLNKDGLVYVEGKIIQYKYDFIKIINDGDVRKIGMLSRTPTTDKQQNITVNPVNFAKSKNQSNGRPAYSFTRSCDNSVGGNPLKWRIQVFEEAYNADDSYDRVYIGQYKIRTLKRGAFGSWQSYATRSQRGTVNHFGPQYSVFVPSYLFDIIEIEPTGTKSWSNANGSQTSEWGIVYFNFRASLNNANNSPLSEFIASFSPSNTATFDFDVETFCQCSIP